MSLSRTTKLGKITINNSVISKEIIKAASKVDDKVFLSNDRGKLLGNPKRVGTGEFGNNILIEEKEESIHVLFYIVIKFGASIGNCTKVILDELEQSLKTLFPNQNGIITINIIGVKSKNIAPRDIEVKRKYEVR